MNTKTVYVNQLGIGDNLVFSAYGHNWSIGEVKKLPISDGCQSIVEVEIGGEMRKLRIDPLKPLEVVLA